LAPSSWSWLARASTSMPAPANRANTSPHRQSRAATAAT
jgi:hypothetical protein